MSQDSRAFFRERFPIDVPQHSGVSVTFSSAEGVDELCLGHPERAVSPDTELEQWRAELLAADDAEERQRLAQSSLPHPLVFVRCCHDAKREIIAAPLAFRRGPNSRSGDVPFRKKGVLDGNFELD
eukprot:4620448-Amphidinium_carterae.2